MIHGLRNDKKAAVNKFAIAKRRLKQLRYMHPVIGFSYDSNTKGAYLRKYELKAIRVGELIARKNGKNPPAMPMRSEACSLTEKQ